MLRLWVLISLVLGSQAFSSTTTADLNEEAKALLESTWLPASDELTQEKRDLLEEANGESLQASGWLDWLTKKPVRMQDVKTWKALGDRYVIGYDSDDKPLGIFDLTYPDIFSAKHFSRTLLGTIGIGSVSLKDLIDLILGIFKDEGMLDDSGDSPEAKTVAYLKKLRASHGDKTYGLSADWWKTIKWKKAPTDAPAEFSLADIELAKMAKSKNKFNSKVEEFTESFEAATGLKLEKGFFSSFKFKKNDKGEYDFYYVPTLTKNPEPFLIADLKDYDSSFKRGIKLYVASEAIQAAVGLIPPPLGTVAGIAVSRWLRLYKRQMQGHQKGALEYLNNAELGDKDSPFAELSADERSRAGTYLANFAVSWINIFDRLFKNRKNTWKRNMTKEMNITKESHIWIKDNSWTTTELSPWFLQGTLHDQKRIFAMGRQKLFTDKPDVALNYNHPNFVIIKRNANEAVKVGLSLVTITTIPFAEKLLKLVWDILVDHQVTEMTKWEARLSSTLFQRTMKKGENWESDIDQLYRQRLNPFEFSREEEKNLIEDYRKQHALP